MSDTDHATTSSIYDETTEEAKIKRRQKLWHWFLNRAWYVHPGAHLRLNISASETYRVLATAAKPSVKRLDLRAVFQRGRRYFIFPTAGGGFRMFTTHKIPWYPRRRTSASAVLYGDFERVDDTVTRLKIRSRIRTNYFLQIFLWPTFMASMLVFMAWPIAVIVFCIGALYWLSWLGHRYNAALEAYEMMFFIEKVLEDFASEPALRLPAATMTGDVVLENDFAEEWDKFVDEMQDEA